MLACGVSMLAADHYPDAVAELEHELGSWKEIGVPPTHVHDGELRHVRDPKVGQGNADHRRPGDEKTEIVQVPAVPGDPAGSGLPDEQPCALQRLLGLACQGHDVIVRENDVWRRDLVLVPLPDGEDPDAGRQLGAHLGQRPADEPAVAHPTSRRSRPAPAGVRTFRLIQRLAKYMQRMGAMKPKGYATL